MYSLFRSAVYSGIITPRNSHKSGFVGLWKRKWKKVGENGETGVRVHIDNKGNIHGYPVNPKQYLGDKK